MDSQEQVYAQTSDSVGWLRASDYVPYGSYFIIFILTRLTYFLLENF